MKRMLMVIIAVSAIAIGAESGHDLFQKALVLERTEGNLPEAIKLYQRIVEHRSSDRNLAAKALMQIAQCQERLGHVEARKTYERLLRDYSDQTELAQAARGRLTALSENRNQASVSAMTARKVWTDPGIDFEGEISPDGKYISFCDEETGDLAIYDLESGTKRRLTDKGPWKESEAYAYDSRWAPDGKQIAYDWYDGHGWDLRVVNIETTKSRVLYKPTKWEVATPCDWSSDGKHVLAFESQQYQTADGNIVLISAEDGSARVLKTVHRSFQGSPRLSPDGRYVALDVPQRESGLEHDIVLLAVDGGRETALVSHPANDWVLDWSPDGMWLLFASDRLGTLGIWAVRVVDGAAKGDPRIVKAGLADILPMGLTRHGSFCYGLSSRNENVYIARLDPSTGKVAGRPEEVTARYEGLCSSSAFSPDGKQLAYACSRGPIVGWNGRNVLRIRSLETGVDREFSTHFSSVSFPRWLPDNRFILLTGVDDTGGGAYKIDTQTWDMKHLRGVPASAAITRSQGGSGFFYVKWEKETNLCRILFRDAEKGEDRELYRGPLAQRYTISLSPDGRWLAFINRTNPRFLRVIPSGGGEPRELYRFGLVGDWNILTAWTADGKYVLFSKPLGEDGVKGQWDLWRVPAEGGEAQRLGLGMRCDIESVHPDGSQIAFSSGGGASIDEVWVLDNLLSPLQPKR
jgi:Tol biopolymer transport system component